MISVCPQDPPHQGQARQEAEAEPTHSSVDPNEDRQHHPLQRQAPTLEEDQAQAVNPTLRDRRQAGADHQHRFVVILTFLFYASFTLNREMC